MIWFQRRRRSGTVYAERGLIRVRRFWHRVSGWLDQHPKTSLVVGVIAVLLLSPLILFVFAMKFVMKWRAVAAVALTASLFLFVREWHVVAALMASLVLHEGGHWVVMRVAGMNPSGIIFIPFMGVAVKPNKLPRQSDSWVAVAIMGPLAGTIPAIIGLAIYRAYEAPWLGACAMFCAYMNFFNLIPVLPLDGGHILRACTKQQPWWWQLLLWTCVGAVSASLWFFGGDIVSLVYVGVPIAAMFAVILATQLFEPLRSATMRPLNKPQSSVALAAWAVAFCATWALNFVLSQDPNILWWLSTAITQAR